VQIPLGSAVCCAILLLNRQQVRYGAIDTVDSRGERNTHLRVSFCLFSSHSYVHVQSCLSCILILFAGSYYHPRKHKSPYRSPARPSQEAEKEEAYRPRKKAHVMLVATASVVAHSHHSLTATGALPLLAGGAQIRGAASFAVASTACV
jgi:hypothetical protein